MSSIITQLTNNNNILTEALVNVSPGSEGGVQQKKIDKCIATIGSNVLNHKDDITKEIFNADDGGVKIRKLLRNIGSNIRKGGKDQIRAFKAIQQEICNQVVNLKKDYQHREEEVEYFANLARHGKNDLQSSKKIGLWLEKNYKWFNVKAMQKYIGWKPAAELCDKLYELENVISEGEKTKYGEKLIKHIHRILAPRRLPSDLEFQIYKDLTVATGYKERSCKIILAAMEKIAIERNAPIDFRPLAAWINANKVCLTYLPLSKDDIFKLAPLLEYVDLSDPPWCSTYDPSLWSVEELLKVIEKAAPRLTYLSVAGSRVTRLPENLPNLKVLDCSGYIASISCYPNLEKLSLRNCFDLNSLPLFDKIKCLTLNGCNFLSSIPPFSSLEVLSLDDMPDLEDLPSLPSLKTLQVKRMFALTTLPSLPSLETIVCDAPYNALTSAHSYPHLDISTCKGLTEEEFRRLKEGLG